MRQEDNVKIKKPKIKVSAGRFWLCLAYFTVLSILWVLAERSRAEDLLSILSQAQATAEQAAAMCAIVKHEPAALALLRVNVIENTGMDLIWNAAANRCYTSDEILAIMIQEAQK